LTNWDDYRYFRALFQVGSVRGAAQQLGVNASTVTRRLDGLEARLGVKLFVRTGKGLQPTSDGRSVMTELEPIANRLGDIELALAERSADVAGHVRITLPDVFAVALLMDEFSSFSDCHQRIRLEFLPTYRNLDLSRGEADIAIRVTNTPPEDLIGRRLGRYRMAVYASHDYLDRHDPLKRPEQCLWLEAGLETDRSPVFKAHPFPTMPLGVRCNNVLLQQAAARSGMGVTLLPCAVGDADGELLRVAQAEPVDAQEIWLLSHPDLRGVVRIQTVSKFIQEAFERLAPRLLGETATS